MMRYCIRCEQEVDGRLNERGQLVCPLCGSVLEDEAFISNWWYVLPLFLGIVGGLIAFALTFDQDAGKAKNFVIVGILLTIAIPLAHFIIFG